MPKNKVLHMTSWYPLKENDVSGVFIKKHIDAIKRFGDFNHQTWHIASIPSKRFFSFKREKIDKDTYRLFTYSFLFNYFRIQARVNLLLIIFMVFSKWNFFRECKIINVHIAPPLLQHIRFLKLLFFKKRKIIVTEHWSAYHYNFNMSNNSAKLNATKEIFKHIDGLITVSKALANDIHKFCRVKKLINYKIVPNIIDQKYFHFQDIKREHQFFMLANWSKLKQPLQIIEAFSRIDFEKHDYKLIIGGKGKRFKEMNVLCDKLNIVDKVEFKGWMSVEEVANQMKTCSCFLHNSDYETFSVVTAEALCSGTPVIVRRIPAIEEYVDDCNGIFVDSNRIKDWEEAFQLFFKGSNFNNCEIAKAASDKFSVKTIAKSYTTYLNSFS